MTPHRPDDAQRESPYPPAPAVAKPPTDRVRGVILRGVPAYRIGGVCRLARAGEVARRGVEIGVERCGRHVGGHAGSTW